MTRILIAAISDAGHRREYIALFRTLFEAANVGVEVRPLALADVFSPDTVFLPMLEEQSVTFMIVAIGRALLGRRSAALMFRPTEAVRSRSPKHLVKRIGLQILRALPSSTVLTILPFAVDPTFSRVAKDWIYDPQLWDIASADPGPPDPLAASARAEAGGRKMIVALGAQNPGKGFDYLSDLWVRSPALREKTLFVVAGKVGAESKAKGEAFTNHGGLLIDRFVTDDELRGLYAVSDLVWACYAPFYDQASGIFGRALQLGIPAIVREGAQVARLADLLAHPTVTLPWDAPEAAGEALQAPTPSGDRSGDAKHRIALLRARSLSVLAAALGLPMEVAL